MSQTNTQPQEILTPLTTVQRDGSVTVPAELRQALNLKEGDFLQAEVRDGGVLLRPISEETRQKAWDELQTIIDRPKWMGPGPEPSEDELTDEVVKLIRAYRQENAQGGAR